MNYRYSYSGADTKCVFRYKTDSVNIESLHTISISVHEAKGMARSLGYKSIKGLSRGIRTIAGTAIFTIIEDHPLRAVFDIVRGQRAPGFSWDAHEIGVGLPEQETWRLNSRLLESLPPMDVLLFHSSENTTTVDLLPYKGPAFTESTKDSITTTYPIDHGGKFYGMKDFAGAITLIQGLEFIDSGLTFSVQDVVSEITASFIARNYFPITMSEVDALQREDLVARVAANEQQIHDRLQNTIQSRTRTSNR